MIHRNTSRGFTLIELAVVMTIIGLLASLCADLLHMGGSIWDKTNARAEGTALVEPVQSLLRLELSRAVPAYEPKADRPLMSFQGTPTSIIFQAPLPQALESNGNVEIKLSVTHSPTSGANLIFAWHPNNSPGWQETTLVASAKEISFEYLSAPSSANWLSSWIEQPTLPPAIRISIEFPQGDSRSWPELIISPMITLDSAIVRTSIHTTGNPS